MGKVWKEFHCKIDATSGEKYQGKKKYISWAGGRMKFFFPHGMTHIQNRISHDEPTSYFYTVLFSWKFILKGLTIIWLLFIMLQTPLAYEFLQQSHHAHELLSCFLCIFLCDVNMISGTCFFLDIMWTSCWHVALNGSTFLRHDVCPSWCKNTSNYAC